MKYLFSFGLIILGLMASSFAGGGKTKTDKSQLCKSSEKGMVRLKTHEICITRGTTDDQNTYELNLNAGITYKVSICDASVSNCKLMVTLLDKHDIPLLTTYDKQRNVVAGQLMFECTNTGKYFLNFATLNGEEGCGVASLNMLY